MRDPPGELTITGTARREAWLRRAMPPGPGRYPLSRPRTG